MCSKTPYFVSAAVLIVLKNMWYHLAELVMTLWTFINYQDRLIALHWEKDINVIRLRNKSTFYENVKNNINRL